LARQLADELADKAWAQRDASVPLMRTVDEALDEAAQRPWPKLGPVTFVDIDDIVGAGAPGGNTHFVKALAHNDRGLKVLVPLHDPAAVEQVWGVPEGTRVLLVLRGTPGYGQPEVSVNARVMARRQGDYGRIVRLDVGSFHVAISERSPLPIHPSFWESLGLSPRKADVIVQKNFFHYRMFYLTTSFRHIPVVSAGATSLERILGGKYRVPMYPVMKLDDWRASDPILRGADLIGYG
jgi:microcystin degradation protein MlrC